MQAANGGRCPRSRPAQTSSHKASTYCERSATGSPAVARRQRSTPPLPRAARSSWLRYCAGSPRAAAVPDQRRTSAPSRRNHRLARLRPNRSRLPQSARRASKACNRLPARQDHRLHGAGGHRITRQLFNGAQHGIDAAAAFPTPCHSARKRANATCSTGSTPLRSSARVRLLINAST